MGYCNVHEYTSIPHSFTYDTFAGIFLMFSDIFQEKRSGLSALRNHAPK